MHREDSERLLVGAGLVTWVVAGLPQLATWMAGRAGFDRVALVWCAAYVSFPIAFLMAAASKRFAAWRRASLAVQTLVALTILALGGSGFEAALLCVVAGQVPLYVGENTGLAWVLAQSAAMVAVELLSPLHAHPHPFAAAAYVGFQLFAFGASRLAAREAEGRAELTRVHAELLATRELFADSARTAERLRIARELHDALGHHLTALSLQLEVARNLAEGRVKEPIDQAHTITKALLSELRTVVSAVREDASFDLAHALRTLVAGIPHPRVHLDVADDLNVEAVAAHTIFRCVQEAVTNAVRHAAAENVFLTVESMNGSVTVLARDDGRGASLVQPGHGLSGLRERIEGLGGTIEIDAKAGGGLTLRALFPARAVGG